MPTVAILSGEVSGDLLGAALARELVAQSPGVRIWGIGSRRMKEAGVELLYDSAAWSAIGVVEALKVYPLLRFHVYPRLLRELSARRPDVVVPIDFGAFNVTVCRRCKEMGLKVLYYVPPGSWRRDGRASAELARVTDRIATPFPWSAERLKAVGARVEFVGHPLLEIARPALSKREFAEKHGLDPDRPVVGLLPGSRQFEIENNTPAMLGAAALIYRELPDSQFIFGAASPTAQQMIARLLSEELQESQAPPHRAREVLDVIARLEKGRRRGRETRLVTTEGILVPASILSESGKSRRASAGPKPAIPPIVIVENAAYDVIAHSDALLICSGTATLEAAILQTPMVILYRGSRLMELEYRLRRIDRKVTHIGLPNILAGERIVPELIQSEATPESLAAHTLRFLREPGARAEVKAALQRVREVLGNPGASARTAEMALDLAGETPDS